MDLNCEIFINHQGKGWKELNKEKINNINEFCDSFKKKFPDKKIILLKCLAIVEINYLYELCDKKNIYTNKEGKIFVEKEQFFNLSTVDKLKNTNYIYKRIEIISEMQFKDTNIFIKNFVGKTICIKINVYKIKIFELKKIISQIIGCPEKNFKIIFNGKIIDSYPTNINNLLSDLNIKKDDTIHVAPLIKSFESKQFINSEINIKCIDNGIEYNIPIKYGCIHYTLQNISGFIRSKINT